MNINSIRLIDRSHINLSHAEAQEIINWIVSIPICDYPLSETVAELVDKLTIEIAGEGEYD